MKPTYTFYLIPGLASDHRAFKEWDLAPHKSVHIELPLPKRRERLPEYARRISAQVDPAANPVIVGSSFGGILAIELAEHIPDAKLALISTIKNPTELRPLLRLFRFFPIYQVLPVKLVKRMAVSMRKRKEGVDDQKLEEFEDMLANASTRYLKWAIREVLRWKRKDTPEEFVHLQGTKDRLFPPRLVEACVTLPGGTHYMAVNQGKEISYLLKAHFE